MNSKEEKMKRCSYCNNFIENSEYSDAYELHKKGCPIREMIEVRLAYAEKKKDPLILAKGVIFKLGRDLYVVTENSEVFAEKMAW